MKTSFVLTIAVWCAGGMIVAIAQSTSLKPGKGNSRADQYMVNPNYEVSKPSESDKGTKSSSGHTLQTDTHDGKVRRGKGGTTQVGTATRPPSGGKSIMGDGSVRFNKQSNVSAAQSSGTGTGKVTRGSGVTDGTSNTKNLRTTSRPRPRHREGPK